MVKINSALGMVAHEVDKASYSGHEGYFRQWTGEKFTGGMGGYPSVQELMPDYYALRRRSATLFLTNPYARGIIRRLITNEINGGLELEAKPEPLILGMTDEAILEWTDDVEVRFNIWAKNEGVCDFHRSNTFYKLQQIIRSEALLSGDVLVIIRSNPRTGRPAVQVVSGANVVTPIDYEAPAGHRIDYGVERDARERIVAYHVQDAYGMTNRILARGSRTGQLMAFLVYGTDGRVCDVRGEPLLGLIMNNLSDMDRFRDSAIRKAFINSLVAFFIKKDQDKPATMPMSGAATRRTTIQAGPSDSNSVGRDFELDSQLPGIVMQNLQRGEEPVGFQTAGVDSQYGEFEASIMELTAWSLEIPPEILRLKFGTNYAASQGAKDGFSMYVRRVRQDLAERLMQPIYTDWLLSEVSLGKITAPGLLESIYSRQDYEVASAWLQSEWTGPVYPSADIRKTAQGYQLLINEGLITREGAARAVTGTRFSRNARRLRKENEMTAEFREPIRDDDDEGTSFQGGSDDDDT